MEIDFQLVSLGYYKIEIDIRTILEQLGFDQQRWPNEWKDSAKHTPSN